MKNKDNYQQFTEKIARSGGLETDLRQFHDPIYRTIMIGRFANGAKKKGGCLGSLVLLVIILWLIGPLLYYVVGKFTGI